ncbi:hypothetical protein FQA39_LY04126 [Lamprigera yunnana]|nr:hypothetical protein FQA39_LY04126 [Lamprigera yunnana]
MEEQEDVEKADQISVESINVKPEAYGTEDEFMPTATFNTGAIYRLGTVCEEGEDEEGECEDEDEEGESEAEEGEFEDEEGESEAEEREWEEEDRKYIERKQDKMKSAKKAIKHSKKYQPSRLRTSDGDRRILSGDFTVGEYESSLSVSSYQLEIEMDEVEEKEEEEEEEAKELFQGEQLEEETEEEEEEKVLPVDREYYYALYRKWLPERAAAKMKNNFLQRKMAEYFRRKKMDHVLKETDQQVDSQTKYDKKLDAMVTFKELDDRKRNNVNLELSDLRAQKDEHQALFEANFASMQNREKDIGSGLINTQTGKPISEKVIERLIKRQNEKMMEIVKMRLTYIKLRNRVNEKKANLHKLDTIGENLHLIDYEQLKIENTSHTEKNEDRDEELNKLKVKMSETMQCLAHVREKTAALQIDYQHVKNCAENIVLDANACRERVNSVKKARDNYRQSIVKMISDSGLLTKPKLLCDMEESIEEIKLLEDQIQLQEHLNEVTRNSLYAIKQNLKNKNIKAIATKKKKSLGGKVCKGRSTLVIPILPPHDYEF